MATFGTHLQRCRKVPNDQNLGRYSLRKVAAMAGINPSYLSLIENGKQAPPDGLLALGGKVSPELQAIIGKRPKLFADPPRSLKNDPDEARPQVIVKYLQD